MKIPHLKMQTGASCEMVGLWDCSKSLHEVSIDGWMDKEDMTHLHAHTHTHTHIYIYTMEYYSAIKKNEILPWVDLEVFGGVFRATPVAHGSSQARDGIGAAAAGRHHSHNNARSKSHL